MQFLCFPQDMGHKLTKWSHSSVQQQKKPNKTIIILYIFHFMKPRLSFLFTPLCQSNESNSESYNKPMRKQNKTKQNIIKSDQSDFVRSINFIGKFLERRIKLSTEKILKNPQNHQSEYSVHLFDIFSDKWVSKYERIKFRLV